MKVFRMLSALVFMVGVSGCASSSCDPKIGTPLPGTNTAVVGVYLQKDGTPRETVKEVVVHPGQNVLYAGPDEFSIVFKNRKTPNGNVENPSKEGVVLIKIPVDIFDKKEFLEEFRKNKSLVFDYGINVNGKNYDPPLRVVPL